MNICVVSREVYPYNKAGIGVYVHNLCRLLVRKGHQVYLITDNHEGVEALDTLQGVNVIPVQPASPILMELFSNYNLNYSYRVYQTLRALSESISLDIVEFSDYFGEGYFSFVEKKQSQFLTQTPFVVKCHGPLYECLLKDEELIAQNKDAILQEDYCIREAQSLSVVSGALGSILQNRLSLTKPMRVLLNPLEIETLQTSQYQNGNERLLLYVGRVQYLKGVDLFVQAAVEQLKRGERFKAMLVGQDVDSYTDYLKAMIPSQYQDCFVFTGRLEREEVLALFNQAYLSVFPSRWEGLSNVAIESILQGCPILTSDVGGLGGIHQYGPFGMKFENENLTDLTEKMEQFLNDEPFRMNRSHNCSTMGACFLDEQVYQTLISFYEQAIDQLYRVTVPRQMSNVIYDNFIHSKELSIELHREVLRLNTELAELHQRWGRLTYIHEQVEEELALLREQAKARPWIAPYGSHRRRKRH